VIIPGRLRALVVDDNTYARAICGAGLKKLGVNDIVEADSGAEAILALMTAPFDFMLMDWYMPEVSGAGLMRVLRDIRFGGPRNTPVILMTGYASQENIATARGLGVNEVLLKPFTTAQLGTAVGHVLGQAQRAGGDDITYL
jgi:two-component system, chemotaxis family, chemotaxis protein CheY